MGLHRIELQCKINSGGLKQTNKLKEYKFFNYSAHIHKISYESTHVQSAPLKPTWLSQQGLYYQKLTSVYVVIMILKMIYEKSQKFFESKQNTWSRGLLIIWGLIPHLNSGRVSLEWVTTKPSNSKTQIYLGPFSLPQILGAHVHRLEEHRNAVRKLPRDEVTWILKVTENIRLTSLYRKH